MLLLFPDYSGFYKDFAATPHLFTEYSCRAA
jgi:hypothetical protein